VLGASLALQRAGFDVVAHGWRGTPGCDDAPHTLGVHERRDQEAALGALRRRLGADIPVGLLGFSMGGAVAIVVAADDPHVRAVCADSAFSDPACVLGEGVRRVFRLPPSVLVQPVAHFVARRTGARLDDFSPVDAVARLAPRPVLLIHGGSDESVAVDHAYSLHAAAGEPKELWVLPGVGHVGAYFADRTAYVDRVAGFFGRALEA